MSSRGKINGYVCDTCNRATYIVHVADGVTPMFLACRAEGVEPAEAECKGQATSMMYPTPPVPDYVVAAVMWEWFGAEPPPKRRFDFQTKRFYFPPDPLTPDEREHVSKGGLLLRPLTDVGREVLAEMVAGGPVDERPDGGRT